MKQRDALVASLGAVFSALLLAYELHNPMSVPNIYADITAFWGRGWVQNGQLPYVNEFFEYPPVSGLLTYLSRQAGGDQASFYNAFSVMSFIAGGVMVWSCWSIVRMRGQKIKALYFVLPSIIIYGIYNYDLFHAMFVMLSIQALMNGKRSASALSLGLAISTKLASAVLLPVFLIQLRGTADRVRYFAAVAGVLAALNFPFMIVNFDSWLHTYTYIGNFGLEDAWFIWIFQDPYSGWAKLFGFGLMGILLIRVYTLKMDLVAKCFLALSAYLLGTYIYSPQFNLLLIPLIAVLAVEHPSLYLWDVSNALIILTWFVQDHPTLPWTLPQEFALLRAVMLTWMATWVLKREGWNFSALFPFRPQKTLNPLRHD